ncbi:hypothetical protein [Chitinophaga arvensicola]|uniref:Uncharacterized protein n=1 Tax=Chitinophaga arvensicola TaxID=29529 RepID=A0A1I0RCI6_9BACT|nr:hypothetical protein [Chitinophaga arvensicola]SEW38435.1 hypothetical protein SAMN04488122_2614 [Chitinophaga arvensicola]
MTQSFSRVFIVVDYYANTSAFAEKCENKARPSMHCNGKCQMMKRLKQEDNRDNKSPDKKSDNRYELITCNDASFKLNIPIPVITTKIHFVENNSAVFKMPRTCFHPPSCS